MAGVILLPTDGSATAAQAARFATELAQAFGDEVLLLAVAEPAIFEGTEDEGLSETIVDSLKRATADEASALRSTGVKVSTSVVTCAHVHRAIIDTAQAHSVHAIVMGTHGRSSLARALLGSVADRVIRESPVPVVLVPPIHQEVSE